MICGLDTHYDFLLNITATKIALLIQSKLLLLPTNAVVAPFYSYVEE